MLLTFGIRSPHTPGAQGFKGAAKTPSEVVHHFNRWPTFMWANWEIAALAGWLRQHNLKRPVKER